MPTSQRQNIGLLFFLVVWAIGISMAHSAPPSGAVEISGSVPAPSDWTVERIRKELADQIKPVQYSSRGDKHTSNCVPLIALLKAADVDTEMKMDPKADPKTKNRLMRLIAVIRASDGYSVVFSLAEISPSIGKTTVWVALDIDGQDLPPRDAPMKLIVPTDGMPARSVHALQTITILDESAPTTQPSP